MEKAPGQPIATFFRNPSWEHYFANLSGTSSRVGRTCWMDEEEHDGFLERGEQESP